MSTRLLHEDVVKGLKFLFTCKPFTTLSALHECIHLIMQADCFSVGAYLVQVEVGSKLPDVQLILPSAKDPTPDSFVTTQELFQGTSSAHIILVWHTPVCDLQDGRTTTAFARSLRRVCASMPVQKHLLIGHL